MKWIGKHIVSLYASFRKDVTMDEDLDVTGNVTAAKVKGTTEVTVGNVDTSLTRASAGDVNIEGNIIYRAGGTDVPVTDGGTGVSTLTANAVLTGNGTSAIQAEAGLTYDSETLTIGDDDDGTVVIKRTRHTDEAGGDLYIRAGDATGTDKGGGNLNLYAGRSTSNAAGGSINIYSNAASGSSGSTLQSSTSIATFRADGHTLLHGDLIFEGPTPDSYETTFDVTDPTADRTIVVPNASGTIALTGVNYSYQYISFTFSDLAYVSNTWTTPSQHGFENHTWNNRHGSGQTQAASDAPSAIDGSSTISVDYLDQGTGIVVPLASQYVGFYGNCRVNNTDPTSARPVFAVFRAAEPSNDNTSDVTATVISSDSYDTASGNRKNRFMKLENFPTAVDLAQGDILFPAIGLDETMNNNTGDIFGSFTIVLRTLLP